MGSELELYDARLSFVRLESEPAEIHLSYAYIHKTKGTPSRATGHNWTQEVVLLLDQPELLAPLPTLPNTVIDGYLKAGGRRYELLPLPFEKPGSAQLHLQFPDDAILNIRGRNPTIRLEGEKIFLDD